MPQEDQAQYGHEILVRREIRIRPQVVRDLPEVRLELLDTGKVVRNHSLLVFPDLLFLSPELVLFSALSRSYSSTESTTTSCPVLGHCNGLVAGEIDQPTEAVFCIFRIQSLHPTPRSYQPVAKVLDSDLGSLD